jgi:Transposase and inactivated derivatives
VLKVVQEESESNKHAPAAVGGSLLDELVRDGARAMLAAALQAEIAAYVDAFADELDQGGHRLVVRNGYHAEREVSTAAGAVPVRQPRVNDKRIDEATGERKRFSSAILPAWARKSPQVAEVLPLLYLHGLSSGDFCPALEQFLGSTAGLSAATVTRLTAQWQDDADAFGKRSLKGTDYVYCWVDGIHLKVRLEQDKVCLLVMIGVRADGKKELIAVSDGFRESSESWADLLRDCRRRGMRAPMLAVGDGALGFWKALREVFPETREQRCWFHVQGNVLAALPKSAHPGAKAALAEIYNAENKDHALKAAKAFGRLRRQVAQGDREDHRAPRRAAGVLRLPSRALDPPAHHQPHRVDLRHGAVTAAGHQGPRLEGGRRRDGVQAHPVRTGQMASRERSSPRRARPGRREVRTGQTRRASRRISRGDRR